MNGQSPYVADPLNPTDEELSAALQRGLDNGSLIDAAEWMARNAPAADGHVVDPSPEQQCYDACLKCGKAIHLDPYGSGQLMTMIGRNAECYGRRP